MKYKISINLPRIVYMLIIFSFIILFLITAKPLLVPLFFSVLLSFMLQPLCKKIEQKIKYQPLAIILGMSSVFLPLLMLLGLFFWQSGNIFFNINNLGDTLNSGVNRVIEWGADCIGMTDAEAKSNVKKMIPNMLSSIFSSISANMSTYTTVAVDAVLILIYTFFILLYRKGIKGFFLVQFKPEQRGKARQFLSRIKKTISKYFIGMFYVMLILALLNSAGLWIIGVDYALFWGLLAAMLAIIPYVGTFIGGLLPLLYSLATTDDLSQPLAILIVFAIIQFLEGNLITPNIVGSTIKINPLLVLISMIVWVMIWGIVGVIAALPLLACIKVLLDYFKMTQPAGLLMSDDLHKNSDKFLEKYDAEEYRFINLFRIKSN